MSTDVCCVCLKILMGTDRNVITMSNGNVHLSCIDMKIEPEILYFFIWGRRKCTSTNVVVSNFRLSSPCRGYHHNIKS